MILNARSSDDGAAVAALAKIGGEARTLMRSLLSHGEPLMRLRAVCFENALPAADLELVPVMEKLLEDTDRRVRREARRFFLRCGEKGVHVLLRCARANRGDIQVEVLQTLEDAPSLSFAVLRLLRVSLESTDDGVCAAALKVLRKINIPRSEREASLGELQELGRHRDPAVARVAKSRITGLKRA